MKLLSIYVDFYVSRLDELEMAFESGKKLAPTNIPLMVEFNAHEESGRIGLNLIYDEAVLCEPQVHAIRDYYLKCLRGISEGVGVEVGEIELVGEREKRQLVEEYGMGGKGDEGSEGDGGGGV